MLESQSEEVEVDKDMGEEERRDMLCGALSHRRQKGLQLKSRVSLIDRKDISCSMGQEWIGADEDKNVCG
jgi:hypothetical protein